ncbi:hypothetical protein [Streptomyces olivaceoviridis]|uniref:hypothetical protein n=1 Tax=Streptomyces olivaceoviridis TaxID=1921 RepID=UPI001678A383|nr:hypothetical protein [Streptomyces olivaceoviridis]
MREHAVRIAVRSAVRTSRQPADGVATKGAETPGTRQALDPDGTCADEQDTEHRDTESGPDRPGEGHHGAGRAQAGGGNGVPHHGQGDHGDRPRTETGDEEVQAQSPSHACPG